MAPAAQKRTNGQSEDPVGFRDQQELSAQAASRALQLRHDFLPRAGPGIERPLSG